MSHHRLVLALVAPLAVLTCNEPKPLPVEPSDAVRCCFLVPYDGLAGSEQASECMTHLVCPQLGEDDTEDVCDPLSCKSDDIMPYGHPGPSGTTIVTGNCTFDVRLTTVEHGGCREGAPATRPHT